MPQAIRREAPALTSGRDDKKLSFHKEYKDKVYLFLIILYPFMSTNAGAKHD
jgi:hypothetical protein